MTEQLELLPAHPDEHLFAYWRKQLAAWPCDVFQFRNMPETTGWSMATQKMCFARWLFGAGDMSRAEFRRWARFNRRVRRRDEVAPIVCQGEGGKSFENMSNEINIPPLDTEWLHRARQRHEEIEAEVKGVTGPISLELEGGIFLRSALAMLDVALPPDGEPHPQARICAEDAMFQMMMGGICMGRLNEMRGGEAEEN